MVEYDYSKLMAHCDLHASLSIIPLADRTLSRLHCKVLRFVVSDIATRNGSGWLRVWTEPRPISEVTKGVFGERCNVEKRSGELLEALKQMSYDNIVHGLITEDSMMSLAYEPFFLSWRKLNDAIGALYPASILRLHDSFETMGCPFSSAYRTGLLKKKFELVHPALRAELVEHERQSCESIVKFLKKSDQFACISKARFKLNLLPRELLTKGVVGVSEAEAGIIPVDTFFMKPEVARPPIVYKGEEGTSEWRSNMEMTVDCDLNLNYGYSHLVSYAMREIRRRKKLPFDYPFFIDVSKKGNLMEVKKVVAEKKGSLWVFCRWIAETLDSDALLEYAKIVDRKVGRFDIIDYMIKSHVRFVTGGFDPGTLMKPSGSIYTHLSEIWDREDPTRRFVYSACIYGIPVVCAYIALRHLKSAPGTYDPYEMNVGLSKFKAAGCDPTSFSVVKKATVQYMSGHPAMRQYELMVGALFGITITDKPRDEWAEGLYDFAVTLSSVSDARVASNAGH